MYNEESESCPSCMQHNYMCPYRKNLALFRGNNQKKTKARVVFIVHDSPTRDVRNELLIVL